MTIIISNYNQEEHLAETIDSVLAQRVSFPFKVILIYRFGVDYLGLNSLFASVLSVLSLMELGFGTAVVYSMYKPAAAGLTAYFYILKAGDIRWVYQEGKGLWYESRFIMIGEAAVNTILNILLCRALGVFGIVLATVISVFVTNFIFCPSLLVRLYFCFRHFEGQKQFLSEYFL